MARSYDEVVEDFAYSRITIEEARRELVSFRVYTDTELTAKLRISWSARLASTKGGSE